MPDIQLLSHHQVFEGLDLSTLEVPDSAASIAAQVLTQAYSKRLKASTRPSFLQIHAPKLLRGAVLNELMIIDPTDAFWHFDIREHSCYIHVFGDRSAMLMLLPDDGSDIASIVPWPFYLFENFECPEGRIKIPCTREQTLMVEIDRKTEKQLTSTRFAPPLLPTDGRTPRQGDKLQDAYLKHLWADAAEIIDAFLAAPPLALGPYPARDAEAGTAAYPVFSKTREQISDPPAKAIYLLEDIAAWIKHDDPNAQSISMSIEGVGVDAQGCLDGEVYLTIVVNLSESHEYLEPALGQLLELEPYRLTLDEMISSDAGKPVPICQDFSSEEKHISSHRVFEALNRLEPIFGPLRDSDRPAPERNKSFIGASIGTGRSRFSQ